MKGTQLKTITLNHKRRKKYNKEKPNIKEDKEEGAQKEE